MRLYRRPDIYAYTASLAVFLVGMGAANPLGTAIALHPFGDRAGMASALIGFMQMGATAIATALASILPLAPATALGGTQALGGLAALALLGLLAHRMRPAGG